MPGRGGRAGFTLIEVTLALALFSIIMLVTYNAVGHAARVRDEVVERGEALRAAAALLDRLERELGAAYAYKISTAKGQSGTLPAQIMFRGLNNDSFVPRDGLVFTCNGQEVWPFGIEDSNTPPHMEVAYDFIYDSEEEQTLLMRRQDGTMDDDPTAGGQLDSLWPVIRGMNLRYLDPQDKSWRDQWDSAATPSTPLPQAVEVTLYLRPPVENESAVDDPLVLGRTILLPHVRPRGKPP